MFEADNSKRMIDAEVAACKSSVRLTPETQMQDTSGHSSATIPAAVDQAAANPGGAPGTGGY